MKALAPLEMLIGQWTGKGTGSYGPFKLEAHVERRGRWLLMRQGARDNDALQFEWRDGDSRKTSRYWKDGDIIHFSYDSNAREGDSGELEHVTFEGTLERAAQP